MSNIQEIWKDIPNYEGLYQVSNLGKIKSLQRHEKRRYNGLPTKGITVKERNLKFGVCGDGYQKVTLVKNGKLNYRLVHRVVMAVFNSESDLQVDHIDEDKTNNAIWNLRYVTCRENHTHYNERRKLNRSSKYIGVNFMPSHGNKWRAAISIKGKATHIGYYDTEEEASKAYEAKRKLYI